jgi:hypothetical protein
LLAERRLDNAVLLIHDGYGHLSPSGHVPFDPDFGQGTPAR